ncbi:MAG: polysaccharide biosynthesis family protein [Hyphomicrobiales bacterium]|nr:polysaccharide biosynthesis family protein [Hyphomicrobiales bacterium]
MSAFQAMSRSLAFGLGFYVPRVVTLATLPIYARALAPRDFALIAIVEMLTGFVAVLVNAGFTNAALRYHADEADRDGQNTVFITALASVLGIGLVLGLVVSVSTSALGGMLVWPGVSHEILKFVPAIMIIAVCDSGNAILQVMFRARGEPSGFLVVTLCRVIPAAALSIYLVVARDMGIAGFLWGAIVGSAGALAGCGVWLCVRNWARPRIALARELVKYAAPYVPLAFFEFIGGRAGLLCLSLTGDARLIATYAMAEKLGTTVQAAYAPIGFVVTPWMFKIGMRQEAPQRFAVLISVLVFMLGLLLIPMGGFAAELVTLIGGASYVDSSPLVFPLALAFGVAALRPVFRAGITITKKTHYMPIVAAVAAGLGLVTSWLLIQLIGLPGAAWGTALTAVLGTGLGFYVSQRFLFVPVRWLHLALTAIIVAAGAASVSAVPNSDGLGLKIAAAIGFLGAAVLVAVPALRSIRTVRADAPLEIEGRAHA